MAFVPGYENDIFISYSHIDNDPVIQGKPGWVDFFQDLLRKRVRVRLGAEIEIFRDAQLRRYGKFSQQLAEKISTSAVFICVLSPRYVQSEWCLHELSQFSSLVGSDRIIKVVKTAYDAPSSDPEHESLFEQIKDVLDTRFYQKDEQTRLFKDLQPEVISNDIPAAIDLTDIVAQNLVELLKQLHASHTASPLLPQPGSRGTNIGPASQVYDENQVTVYLAETTKDLIEKRAEIRTELSQYNCRILPDKPLPHDADELVNKVREHLEQARLSVHLMGANYGAIPESEERSIPQIQYDLAGEISRERPLIPLVWMPDGIAPTDERQQKFIAHVKNTSTEFLRTKIEDLKTEIHKKLAPAPKNVWGDEDDGSINVSLFYHEQDRESVAPLFSYLTVGEFFRVKLPLKDAQSFASYKQLLQTSDAVILYYGAADEDWFVNIWRLIQRQISASRDKPVLAKAIYAGKPTTTEKTLLESDDPIVIKNYGPFTPTSLTPFIEKIRAAKEGGAR